MSYEALLTRLRREEGLRLDPYLCPSGKLTIGYGHNLEAHSITLDEAEALLRADVQQVIAELHAALPWFDQLDQVRQEVLIEMGFNLGAQGLLKFTTTLNFVAAKKFLEASTQMLKSKWAAQVPARAKELAQMMRTGNRL